MDAPHTLSPLVPDIEALLADLTAPLMVRITDLETERDTYRLMTQQALQQLQGMTQRLDRLRSDNCRLLDALRARPARSLAA